MKTTINNELIRSLGACYDPKDKIKEKKHYPWASKYGPFLRIFGCAEDFCQRFGFSVRELSLIDNPDPRSVEACNVAERHANGEATED